MADEETEVPGGGGNNRMLLMVVGVNLVVVLLAVGGVVFALRGQAPAAAAADAEEEPETLGPLVAVDSVVVNLDEADANHYLRAAFQLELVSPDRQDEVTQRMVPVRNAILLHLSSLHVADTVGRDAREEILTTVRALANEAIGAEVVRRVYFSEFVVQ